MINFSEEKVLLLHKLITEETGGDPNIRDIGLLESALNSAYQTFDGKELFPTKEEKAAKLVAEMHREGEISDDNLETVSGGITIAPPSIHYGYEYAWKEIDTALDIACSRNMYSGLATAIGNIRFASFFGATVLQALEKCISIAESWTEYNASDILQHLQNAHKALTTHLKQ